MKSIISVISLITIFMFSNVSWGTDFTGVWKSEDCSNFWGLQIKPTENQLYSVSFCGIKSCSKPGEWTPNTRIKGDPKYKVVSPSEIGIKREDQGYFFYKKCTSDPTWIFPKAESDSKSPPPVPCEVINNIHPNKSSSTTLIALLVLKEDLLRNKKYEEILLISKYSQGKYDVVSRWDDIKKLEISERRDLLRDHNKYIVYQNGEPIKEAVVNKICLVGYECSAIDIGCVKTTSSLTTIKNKMRGRLEKEYSGFDSGINFKEKTSAFIALNSDSPTTKKQKTSLMIKNVSQSVVARISEYTKNKILKNQPSINPKDVKITQVLAYNLTGDKSVQYVVEAKAENEKTKVSGIYIVQSVGNSIKEIFSTTMSNDPESWGNGYSFLDVFDIDGDGIPELIFEVRGWESTGYQIYQLEKGSYKKVFDDVISGC